MNDILSTTPPQTPHYPTVDCQTVDRLLVPPAGQTHGEGQIGLTHLQQEPLLVLGSLPQAGIQKVEREVAIT